MLIILGGLPGVGKSTVAQALAKEIKAFYVRIDSIENAIRKSYIEQHKNDDIFSEGYFAAYAVIKDNIKNGLTVIADSVNTIELTRSQFRKIATDANVAFLEIEIICSDTQKHQHQIKNRKSDDPEVKLPTWKDVLERTFEPWHSAGLTIDTARIQTNKAVDLIKSRIEALLLKDN